jgi:hypothetical protein
MATALEVQCATILYAAKDAELGLIIKTNNPYKARASLYKARRDLGDVELAKLQIRVSPDDSEGELWILRESPPPTISLEITANDL